MGFASMLAVWRAFHVRCAPSIGRSIPFRQASRNGTTDTVTDRPPSCPLRKHKSGRTSSPSASPIRISLSSLISACTRAPPRVDPRVLPGDAHDLVLLHPARPYRLRLHLQVDRRAFHDDWRGQVAALFAYLDVDGNKLYGVVYYPIDYKAGQKYPVVFNIYEDFFDDTFNGTINVLTSNGYVVMQPSVKLEIGYPGESWMKGVTAAANKLIEMGVADAERLGVQGTSYGGYATNLLITQTNRFRAAINISGKVNMISFYTDSPRLGVRNTHAPEKSQDRIGGTLWEYPERYLEHSAVLKADRIKTPLLNITGDQDPNVPASQSREIYYALRRLGREVEWVRYVNGAHRPPNSVAEAIDFETRILSWYDKYLKSEEKKNGK